MAADAAPVVVVGAGLSGVSCARVLAEAGLPVRLLERSPVVGGRMASRRLRGRPVDLGASYLTADDPDFAAVVRGWVDRGAARAWTDTFTALNPGEPPERKQGPMRFGAPHGLRALVADLADGLHVEQRTVTAVERTDTGLRVDGDPARAVVLAMPDAQAARLAGTGLEDLAAQLTRTFEPVIALAAGWPEREWPDDLDGAFVNDHPDLAWVADDGRRRGDDAPVLVAHSTGELAAHHLADPEGAAPALLGALRALLGVGAPGWQHVHRWSLAKPLGERRDDAPAHRRARRLLRRRLGARAQGAGRVGLGGRAGRRARRAARPGPLGRNRGRGARAGRPLGSPPCWNDPSPSTDAGGVLTVAGAVDEFSVVRLRTAITDRVSRGDVVVDLSDVDVLPSVGVGVLARAAEHARREGRSLHLVAGPDTIAQRVLQVCGLPYRHAVPQGDAARGRPAAPPGLTRPAGPGSAGRGQLELGRDPHAVLAVHPPADAERLDQQQPAPARRLGPGAPDARPLQPARVAHGDPQAVGLHAPVDPDDRRPRPARRAAPRWRRARRPPSRRPAPAAAAAAAPRGRAGGAGAPAARRRGRARGAAPGGSRRSRSSVQASAGDRAGRATARAPGR